VPREMTVEQAFLRVFRHPAIEIRARSFCFTLFVEHMHADVCAMSIAWIASEALLDQIPRLVESSALAGGECKHAEKPPVRAVMRGQTVQQFEEFFFALLVTRETDQAEHAGRRRERHRIQRILCDVSLRRGKRIPRFSLDRERDCINVALLARRRTHRQFASSGCRGPRLRHVCHQKHCPCERYVRERKIRIGFERAPEVRLGAGDRRQNAVRAHDVSVARNLRRRRQRQPVTIRKHGAPLTAGTDNSFSPCHVPGKHTQCAIRPGLPRANAPFCCERRTSAAGRSATLLLRADQVIE